MRGRWRSPAEAEEAALSKCGASKCNWVLMGNDDGVDEDDRLDGGGLGSWLVSPPCEVRIGSEELRICESCEGWSELPWQLPVGGLFWRCYE